MRARLTTVALLVALVLLAGLAGGPGVAAAQTTCVPGSGDTYVPGSGEPPPGGVIVGPDESCPETEPVVETPSELPPPPKCDPCPKKDRSATRSRSTGGSTPVSYTGTPSVERLPFTGLDAIKWALLLGGIGLVAVGAGLGLRRLTTTRT